VSIGDVVYSFPGTLEYAKKLKAEHGNVALHWTNAAVGDLFPHEKYGFGRIYEDPREYGLPMERISFHDLVHHGGPKHSPRHGHPTCVFLAHLGFVEMSSAPVAPEFYIPDLDVPSYDIVIAPYVLADMSRMWPMYRWQQLVDSLKDDWRIAVIGGTKLPPDEELRKISNAGVGHFHDYHRQQMSQRIVGADEVFDRPLVEVACMLQRAKLVITVDSGPSRMMHGIQGPTHIILAHATCSSDWCTHPGAIMLHNYMHNIEAERVISLAREHMQLHEEARRKAI
jgi:hypothetical protein